MTTLRTAFEAVIHEMRTPTDLSVRIWEALLKKPKTSRDNQRGYSTTIGFRTYSQLKNQGVLE
jgi:hypothetical protein